MSKPPARTKPKPPPYPRPVPQLVIEELPPTSADATWDNAVTSGQGGNDVDDELEQRAAKRRRIEACATAYLRGEPLYIMTAQLKGPFQQSWRNPWAKRRESKRSVGVEESKSLEIAETTKKTSTRLDEETTDRLAIADTTQRLTSPDSKTRDFGRQHSSARHPPSPFVDVAKKTQKSPIDLDSKVPPRTKERRVEEWLRRNESFAKKSEVQVLSSPTPHSRSPRNLRESPDTDVPPQTSQSEPLMGNESLSLTFHPASSAGLRRSRRVSEAVQQVQRVSRDMQNIVTATAASESAGLQDEVRRMASSAPESMLNPSRAEYAILKTKHETFGNNPTARTHLSPFEYRKMAREQKQKFQQDASFETARPLVENDLSKPGTHLSGELWNEEIASKHGAHDDRSGVDASRARMAAPPQRRPKMHAIVENDEPLNSHMADQFQSALETAAADNSTRRPALLTAMSEVSTADLLPSAQPRLEPQHSTSSAIRDEKLQSIRSVDAVVEEDTNRATHDSIVVENPGGRQEDKVLEPVLGSNNNRGEQLSGPLPESEGFTSISGRDMAEVDKQDLLHDPELLVTSSVKNAKQAVGNETAATVTKARPSKKRKTASFAVDPSSLSSHGSIQDVMKARISKKLDSPPPIMFGKDALDIEVSDDENGTSRKRRRPSSIASKPKSILKSTNPAASSTALRRSKSGLSTEAGHGGQNGNVMPIPSGQNEIKDDNFDLDAAIDDLGSFLGTWDAEKEASSIGIEL